MDVRALSVADLEELSQRVLVELASRRHAGAVLVVVEVRDRAGPVEVGEYPLPVTRPARPR